MVVATGALAKKVSAFLKKPMSAAGQKQGGVLDSDLF